MDIEKRSLKYVEFHMFETFDPIFREHRQIQGFWHDDHGYPRYESLVENHPTQKGANISYLFPHFDPESTEYDNYNYEI